MAAHQGLTEAVAVLLQHGADVAGEGQAGAPLHYAAVGGCVPVARYLLKAGADPMALARSGGYTPLYLAALHARLDMLRMLLGLVPAAHVGATMTNGATALHGAAMSGSLDVVAALLDAGADPNARSDRGHTPRDYAELSFPGNKALSEALGSGRGRTARGGEAPGAREVAGRDAAQGGRFVDAARIASGEAAALGELKYKYRPGGTDQARDEASARRRKAKSAKLARKHPREFFAQSARARRDSVQIETTLPGANYQSPYKASQLTRASHARATSADAKVSAIKFPTTREFLEGTSARDATQQQLLALRELKKAALAELDAVETDAEAIVRRQQAIQANLDALRDQDRALEAEAFAAAQKARRDREDAEAWRDAEENARAAHGLELHKRKTQLLANWDNQKAAIVRELQGEAWSTELELREHLERRQAAHRSHLEHTIAEAEAAYELRRAELDAKTRLERARKREEAQALADAARYRKATREATDAHEARLQAELADARRQHRAEAAALRRRIQHLESRQKHEGHEAEVRKRRVVSQQSKLDTLRDNLDAQDARVTANIIRSEQERLMERIARTEAKTARNMGKIEALNETTAAEIARQRSLTADHEAMHRAEADAAKSAWAAILDQEAAAFEAAKVRLVAKIRTQDDFSKELAELEALEDRAAARLARPVTFAPPERNADASAPPKRARTLAEQSMAAARLAVPRTVNESPPRQSTPGGGPAPSSPGRRSATPSRPRTERKRNWEAERASRIASGYTVPGEASPKGEADESAAAAGVRGFATASAAELAAKSAAVSSMAKSNRKTASAKIHLPDTSVVVVPWQPKLLVSDLISSLVKRYELEAQAAELMPGILDPAREPTLRSNARFRLVYGCSYALVDAASPLVVNKLLRLGKLANTTRLFTLQDVALLNAVAEADAVLDAADGDEPAADSVAAAARTAAVAAISAAERSPASTSASTSRSRSRRSARKSGIHRASRQLDTINRLAQPRQASRARERVSDARAASARPRRKRNWEAEYLRRKALSARGPAPHGKETRRPRQATPSSPEHQYEYEYFEEEVTYTEASLAGGETPDSPDLRSHRLRVSELDVPRQVSPLHSVPDEYGLYSVPTEDGDAEEAAYALLASPQAGGDDVARVVTFGSVTADGHDEAETGAEAGADGDETSGDAGSNESDGADAMSVAVPAAIIEMLPGSGLSVDEVRSRTRSNAELYDQHPFSSPTLHSGATTFARPAHRPVVDGIVVEGNQPVPSSALALEALVEEEVVKWAPVRIKSKKCGPVHSLRYRRLRRIVISVASKESETAVQILGVFACVGGSVNARRLYELALVEQQSPGRAIIGWDNRLDKKMFGGVSAKGERYPFTLVVDVRVDGHKAPVRLSKTIMCKVYDTDTSFSYRTMSGSSSGTFEAVAGGHPGRVVVMVPPAEE
ncbi:ankyrin domain-containing protein [Thecamonas trahens ATCC 50062]|uniref:Ankyrin domain-containing protein n=1 Tax=Thecamonas trahens ATCC 50062 TaxID=461836 RepID=A0A0L0DDD7_THETB|nr:ankyrin domain-containing protein [Thecamonas trahens ATCC 50062]KNC50101.1 ankyrin domain-containing protein [Thecamonas trahens ATCC 50062]|eukprot:XP_013757260.1 ankyrin domain-containing protein [Thecamonas trahens ATCC 50062]